jgi:uncharacterized protein involved in type VI secretion and phage assembly
MTASDTTITPQQLGRTAPIITVDGSALSAPLFDALLAVRIERGLGVPGRVTLRFRDVGHPIAKASTFRLNTEIEVKIESTSVITANVTAISASRHRGELAEYVVTADDKAFKLTRGVDPTVYLRQSCSDAISALADSVGLVASVSGTAFPSTQMAYQMRTGTAMAYLNSLCRRAGAVWWVEDTTLNVKAASENVGTVSKNANDDMLDFSLRASGLYPTAVEVDSWDAVSKQAVTANATTPTSRGTSPKLVASYLGQASELSDAKSSFGGYNPEDGNDAIKIAEGLLTDAANGAVIARGMCYADPSLKPGTKLTLTESDIFNGDYFISEVEHTYNSSGFYTKFVAGPHRTIDLVDSLGRPEEDPGLYANGIVVGKVTDNKEPENTSLGRVKVQYLAQPGQPESTWARVAGIGSGSNRGIMFHPEIGDEVIVGFEFNDMRRPIVLGSVWSGTDNNAESTTLPDGNKKVKARQIASVGGHIVEWGDDDTADTGTHLKFTVKGGPTMRLGKDKTTLDTNSKPLEITVGSAKITVDDQGNITIQGAKIDLKADQDVSISGMNVNIKANANAKVEASAQLQLKGTQAELNGSGMAAVKGGMVQIN